MHGRCPLPVRASIRDLLVDLLGRRVRVADGPPQELAAPAYAACYVRDDDAPAAVLVCDLALAGRAGAAIGGLTAVQIDPQIDGGELSADVRECFREVVNVLARVLNSPTSPHVRLAEIHPVPGPVPAGVAGVVLEPAARGDYTVAIDGYGDGAMTVLIG